jgi:hypothetical protein
MAADGERYQPVFRNPGDWVALASIVPFVVSVFVLKWIAVSLRVPSYVPLVGGLESRRLRKTVGLLEIPWYWILLVLLVLAAFIVCFFLIRTRGWVTLGAGLFYLLFAVLFFFGAWYKINAIIGDIMDIFAKLPLIGPILKDALSQLTKDALVVRFQPGYYVFIAAGALLAAGGLLRLLLGSRGVALPVADSDNPGG